MTVVTTEPPSEPPDDVEPLDSDSVHKSPSRASSAVALRAYGASYLEIARTVGYSDEHAARKAVEYSLGRSVKPETRDEMRTMLSQRLDRMVRAALKKGLDHKHPEQLAALRTALAISDRQARLLGLDDPAQLAIYTPGHAEIEAFVAQAMAMKMAQLPAEADVIEGDYTEVEVAVAVDEDTEVDDDAS